MELKVFILKYCRINIALVGNKFLIFVWKNFSKLVLYLSFLNFLLMKYRPLKLLSLMFRCP